MKQDKKQSRFDEIDWMEFIIWGTCILMLAAIIGLIIWAVMSQTEPDRINQVYVYCMEKLHNIEKCKIILTIK